MRKIAIPALLAGSFLGLSNDQLPIQALFGSKKSEETQAGPQNTKTYIWGNGIYQPRPDASMRFRNFEPKLINTFLGQKNINLKDLSFGEFHEGGITTDGKVYIWRKHVLDSSQSDNDNVRSDLVLLDGGKNNKQLTFSKGFAWVLKDDGRVFQYKINVNVENDTDEIKDITVNTKPTHIEELKDVMQICTGEDHFVALDKVGTVFAMGNDTLGQCGQGSQNRSTGPPYFEKRVRVPQRVNSLSDIKKVACGGNHTLALHKEGFVFGWGSNSLLQLSHENEFATVANPLIAVFSPLRIEKDLGSIIATDIAAGDEFSMIVGRHKINNETEVYGCGHNIHGELGAGNLSHIQDVIKIESLSNYKIKTEEGEKDVRVSQIACGKNHCIALLNVGAVIEWGANEYGQLGNRKRVFSENPIIMKDFTEENVVKVSCGYDNSGVIAEYNEAREQEKKKKKAEEKK